jgi:histidine triad (HIT) family protein
VPKPADIEEARRWLAQHPRKGDPTAEPGETLDEKATRLCAAHAAAQSTAGCPFCAIVAGQAPATIVHEWPETLALLPLGPVVDGHTLVIPKQHVADFATDPDVTAQTMRRAAELMHWTPRPMNVITSRGREATQSVFHLHLHLVPRAAGDGLALPWYSGKGKSRSH